MPVIPAREDFKFKVSMGYTASSRPGWVIWLNAYFKKS
jgi:hypothetical protein